MHDSPVDFRGKPSVNVQNVFTWMDPGSVSVSINTADITMDVTQPFSVCISTYNIGQFLPMASSTALGTITSIDDVTPSSIMWPITITYTQGASFPQLPLLNSSNPNAVTGMEPDPALMNEKTDVCGWGIEVVNATPMLNIGGTCTCASIPQFDNIDSYCSQMAIQNGASMGESFGPWSLKPIAACPTTEAALLKFQGSKQWNAKEGCYAIVPINWVDYTESPHPTAPILFQDSLQVLGGVNVPAFTPLRSTTTVGGANYGSFPRAINYLNCDSQCIMLTGLDPKTELTIRYQFWGQTEPKSNVVQLRAAKPPVPWNQDFYEFATKMKGQAPTSTFFTNNPSGEWWKTILSTAADIAPSILSMIPHPAARALAPIAAMAAPMLKEAANTSKAKRKTKNQAGAYGAGMKKNKTGNIVPQKPKKALTGQFVQK